MNEALAAVGMLGVDEISRRHELEATIDRGLATFVEVGAALMEIRDSRLYRDSHNTFENYCRDRWGFQRHYANRLVQAAEVAGVLVPIGSTPSNEAQARELAPLLDEPETLRAAWQEASEDGEPTAAKVREVVSTRMGVHYSSESEDWSTPQEFFDRLNTEFNFNVDVCATAGSAKCERFFTPAEDGLLHNWTGTCWMNPPYGTGIAAWVRKAYESAQAGATVVCLVPARVDTGWWWDYCRYGEVRFLRGRLRFGGGDAGAPFPSAVVIFGRNAAVKWWDWKAAT